MLVFDDRKVSQKELSPHATQGTCSSTPRNHWFCGCVFSCRCQWKKPSSWMGIAWGPPIYPRMCGFSFWDGYPYQKNTCLEHGTYNSANPGVDWKLKLVGNLKNESRGFLIRIREVRPDISQWKAGLQFLCYTISFCEIRSISSCQGGLSFMEHPVGSNLGIGRNGRPGELPRFW